MELTLLLFSHLSLINKPPHFAHLNQFLEQDWFIVEVLVKGLFFGYHLRSLGLPIFYNAISMNNNLKYIFFNIMQNSGFAGQKTKLG